MYGRSYSLSFLKFALILSVIVGVMVFGCLVIGARSSGETISAFTTNHFETTDVWLMDVSRNKFIHLQVKGHQNYIPVWSPEERQLVYYPRAP